MSQLTRRCGPLWPSTSIRTTDNSATKDPMSELTRRCKPLWPISSIRATNNSMTTRTSWGNWHVAWFLWMLSVWIDLCAKRACTEKCRTIKHEHKQCQRYHTKGNQPYDLLIANSSSILLLDTTFQKKTEHTPESSGGKHSPDRVHIRGKTVFDAPQKLYMIALRLPYTHHTIESKLCLIKSRYFNICT